MDRSPFWPFTKPSVTELRQSPKKVFAHYFSPFPVSIDNADSSVDYYTIHYLNPAGEDNKFLANGGFLRERPLPRPVRPEDNWWLLDMEDEIQRAIGIGLDGFIFDVLETSGAHWNRLNALFQAAEAVDTGFKIMLMPDMTALSAKEDILACVTAFKDNPCLFKLNGKIVLAPYVAETQTPAWWKEVLDTLANRGVDIAFVPLFQGWYKSVAAFAPISTGMSDWGDAAYDVVVQYWQKAPSQAHAYLPIWMMPVRPQDFRPKDFVYWEAANSSLFRESWKIAIDDNADWVQLITWNDYSECSEIAPSTGIRYSFYDLTAFYTAWFKTGVQPEITRDVLYYFHRIEPSHSVYDTTKQTKPFVCQGTTPTDQIELLAFLTAPGRLEIENAGITDTLSAAAGITSFKVPLKNGSPIFRLVRNDSVLVHLQSDFAIKDTVVYQDLLYRGGSSIPKTDPSSIAQEITAPHPGNRRLPSIRHKAPAIIFIFPEDEAIQNIRLYNLKGQCLLEQQGGLKNQITMNANGLPTGLYLWKAVTKTGSLKGKLVICR